MYSIYTKSVYLIELSIRMENESRFGPKSSDSFHPNLIWMIRIGFGFGRHLLDGENVNKIIFFD